MITKSSDLDRWRRPDPLSAVLIDLRLASTFICRVELRAPWALDIPERDFVSFHFVSHGRCSVRARRGSVAPAALEMGDLVLVPMGLPHLLASEGRAKPINIETLPQRPISPVASVLRHGGRGRRTVLICGGVTVESSAGRLLLRQLPDVLVLKRSRVTPLVRDALEAMHEESQKPRLGGVTLMTRLADVIFVQAIRGWLETSNPEGWLAALRDEHIGRAIASAHDRPETRWSISTLSREARLSRSRFSERFTELMGESAMHYVRRLRMERAAELLRSGKLTTDRLAERFGYESGPAFARAFKREIGLPPGALRRRALDGK